MGKMSGAAWLGGSVQGLRSGCGQGLCCSSCPQKLDGAGGAAPGLPRAVAGGLVPPRTE